MGLTFAWINFRSFHGFFRLYLSDYSDFYLSAKISTSEKFGMIPTAKINTREKNEKKTMIRDFVFF